tara:strand:- start:2453 stop:2635 length:183 start_codon:yes stop_codon:yes gene_type:complete
MKSKVPTAEDKIGQNFRDHDDQIEHLMCYLHFRKEEAVDRFYYSEYDPTDWIDSAWEEIN